jgi:hypothetical protein
MFLNFLHTLTDWCQQHPWVSGLLLGLSAVALLATVFMVPWVILRIPADYFVHPQRNDSPWGKKHPKLRIAIKLGKNLLGLLLLLLGIAMTLPLVPGPGIFTVLLGLALVDVPGKQRLECWIVSRHRVFTALNKLRTKHGRMPLEAPK